jgi:GntR family transcriptional regulator
VELRIDAASAVPIYVQVMEQIRALVASRAMRAGDRLPSVRELASSLRVNRNTAAKAYQMLESDGVIETRQGSGCFIASGVSRWSKEERYRRLDAALDRLLVEASSLEIPFDEIPGLMKRRARRFPAQGGVAGRKGS